MPIIVSLLLKGEQIVARVELDRSETVAPGDILPHYAGKKYRALSVMSLIDGKEGAWRRGEHGLDVRHVDVPVVEHTAPVSLGPTRLDREKSVERARVEREAEVRLRGHANPPQQLKLLTKKRRGGSAPSG